VPGGVAGVEGRVEGPIRARRSGAGPHRLRIDRIEIAMGQTLSGAGHSGYLNPQKATNPPALAQIRARADTKIFLPSNKLAPKLPI